MARTKPVIDVKGLRVERDVTILEDVTWQVERGQHWSILGANGSGKTSLLGALTAYLPFSSGEIAVYGRVYGTTDWRELRKSIGLVSASLLQRVSPSETAVETVVSGKYAMVNYWGEVSAADRRKAMGILNNWNATIWRIVPGASSPGRAAADRDRPGHDGESPTPSSR